MGGRVAAKWRATRFTHCLYRSCGERASSVGVGVAACAGPVLPATGFTPGVRRGILPRSAHSEAPMNRPALMIVAALALGAGGLTAPASSAPKPKGPDLDHIVVIYEENHSFDNLFGGWERVNGLPHGSVRPQVAPDGSVLPCLPQNDVNLASPPL